MNPLHSRTKCNIKGSGARSNMVGSVHFHLIHMEQCSTDGAGERERESAALTDELLVYPALSRT